MREEAPLLGFARPNGGRKGEGVRPSPALCPPPVPLTTCPETCGVLMTIQAPFLGRAVLRTLYLGSEKGNETRERRQEQARWSAQYALCLHVRFFMSSPSSRSLSIAWLALIYSTFMYRRCSQHFASGTSLQSSQQTSEGGTTITLTFMTGTLRL